MKTLKKLTALCAVLALVCSCALAETVVTSFYPVWLITRNLTEGLEGFTVENLAEPATGCLHDYTLQNSDMVALSRADAFLINGAGMEPFLPLIASAYPELPVVDASAGVLLLSSDEDGSVNPHIWLDPARAAEMGENLARELMALFPDRAPELTRNLAAWQERMGALRVELLEGLADTEDRPVVLFHEALPYLAEACDLSVAAAVNKEPEDDLPTSELAQLLELIEETEPRPLILKSTEEDRTVSILAAETGAEVLSLDPLTTGPENPANDYYETVMLNNLHSLQTALKNTP